MFLMYFYLILYVLFFTNAFKKTLFLRKNSPLGKLGSSPGSYSVQPWLLYMKKYIFFKNVRLLVSRQSLIYESLITHFIDRLEQLKGKGNVFSDKERHRR